jgi:hypothetical protein
VLNSGLVRKALRRDRGCRHVSYGDWYQVSSDCAALRSPFDPVELTTTPLQLQICRQVVSLLGPSCGAKSETCMVSMSSITEASSPHARARAIVRRHRRRRIVLPGATGAHPAAWPIVRSPSRPPRNQDGRHARPARWVRVGIESVRSIKTNTPGRLPMVAGTLSLQTVRRHRLRRKLRLPWSRRR